MALAHCLGRQVSAEEVTEPKPAPQGLLLPADVARLFRGSHATGASDMR